MTHAAPGSRAPDADWVQRPERSNMAMLGIMSWISLRLGRPAGRLVLCLISAYFLCFAPAARRAARAYLQRALGRPAGWRDLARHFFSFSATIHDRVYLLNDRFDLFDIEIEGAALIEELIASGRGGFLFGGHLGSFEVTRAIGRKHPALRVVLTMYEDNARKISAALDAINPAARPEIIALGHLDAMLKVQDALANGALVGVLADRTLGREATLPVPLLGTEASFPTGPFRMAAMLRRPVLFMAGLYLGGNRYRIRFERIADFSTVERDQRGSAIDAAVRTYASCLEGCCREAPFNWFNFFDFWQQRGDPR
ncbi:acyl-CoA synthetase [Accumulibacter sp.]|uniref:LpxL/LpxP family acyltransferase n=1 Tax=Accumulibacter sp. TaxID=2053492 RepID=UPI0028C42D06|nr:acyl-CoA synthetase [Accumulibacter sp.]